jgi:hypothetical protein
MNINTNNESHGFANRSFREGVMLAESEGRMSPQSGEQFFF